MILQVSQQTNVPVNVIKGIMWVESNGRLDARSPLTSSGYYFGLMQIGQTSAVPSYMKDVMWACGNAYNQVLAGATELNNKALAIGTYQWDLVAGAYFGYGTDVNGTTTSSYMAMFRNHVLNLTGTTPGGNDWIMPPTPTPGPTLTAVPALFAIGATVEVGSDRINIRSAAGLSASPTGVLLPGTRATILQGPVRLDNYDWYRIETTTGLTGWSAGQLLKLASGVPQPSPSTTPTRTPTPSRTPTSSSQFSVGDGISVNVPLLNLRLAPSLSSQVTVVLLQGDRGTVTGSAVVAGGFTWLPVTIPGKGSGWIASAYVQKTTAPPASATSTATRTPAPSRTPTTAAAGSPFAVGDAVRVNVPRLNLRSSSNPGSTVVVVLLQNQTGTVVGNAVSAGGYIWVPVNIGGRSGWVASQYITKTTGSTASQTPTRTSSPTAGPSQTNGDYEVNVPILNLRASPSLSGTVLAKLTSGLTVTYLGTTHVAEGFTWYRIQTPTQVGWVASQYLTRVTGASAPTPTRTPTLTPTATTDPALMAAGDGFQVTAGLLNMRTSYGTSSTIIRSLPLGTTGSIIEGPQTASGYHWYRVSTPLGTGWVVGAYIQKSAVFAASLADAPGLTVSETPEPTTPATEAVTEPAATATTVPAVTELPTIAPESPTEDVPAPTATEAEDPSTATLAPPTATATDTPVPTATPTATATITPLPDSDGDGVEDALDACPGVADTGTDTDGDGIDDACDPTPLGEPTAPPVVEYQVTGYVTADTSVSAVDPAAPQPADQVGGLPVGGAMAESAYVTLWVEGIGGSQITNATLYLPVVSGSGNVTVSIIPGGAAFDEWSLTGSSAPAGSAVTTVWASAGSEIPIDLTGWIGGDGMVTIVVTGGSDPAVVFGSKEGGWPARIVITALG